MDFDNDSQLEIAIANGHVYRDAEPPSTYAQRMQILFRESTKRYAAFDLADAAGYLAADHVGRAMWTVDATRDGKQDLAVTHQTEPFALLMNETQTKHSWVKFELIGVDDSRDAVGAVVTVSDGSLNRISPVLSGNGFYCASERSLHFGLGADHKDGDPIRVTVTWPNMSTTSYEVTANEQWLLVQGDEQAFLSK